MGGEIPIEMSEITSKSLQNQYRDTNHGKSFNILLFFKKKRYLCEPIY